MRLAVFLAAAVVAATAFAASPEDRLSSVFQAIEANKLDDSPDMLALEKAEKLTTNAERRLYLTSCWLEQLCTAEARVLGWVYQEIYGRPFTPAQ